MLQLLASKRVGSPHRLRYYRFVVAVRELLKLLGQLLIQIVNYQNNGVAILDKPLGPFRLRSGHFRF